MPQITPFLTFNDQAEQAIEFYTALFPDSRILKKTYYGEGMPLAAGTLLVAEFELLGKPYTALNAGENFRFSDAFSMSLRCENQPEVDHYWSALTEGGEEIMCGWCRDRFGLAWQVNPPEIELVTGPDPEGAARAMQAMMQMVKIDGPTLRRAYDATG
jgi:predicted 3-demethylubiquinone-9 3-methyltransferase (glyoxalase superfamily)